MNVNILGDFNWESKVDHAMKVLRRASLGGDFGQGLSCIVIVLMCRDQAQGHKQRVRHSRADSTLSIDVMLDLAFFIAATHSHRRAKIAEQLVDQVGTVLDKKRIQDFDAAAFLKHFERELESQLNGADSTRFDATNAERAPGF